MGKFVVITGPSAAGKNALTESLLQAIPNSAKFITMTTRAPRLGEKDGIDYFFVSREEFESRLERGEFFEHAEVYGNLYGSSKQILDSFLEKFAFVFAIIDVQGSMTLKRKIPEAFVIFIRPGSINDVKRRLEGERTGVPEQEILRRIETASKEMRMAEDFDAVINNVEGRFDKALGKALELLNRRNTP